MTHRFSGNLTSLRVTGVELNLSLLNELSETLRVVLLNRLLWVGLVFVASQLRQLGETDTASFFSLIAPIVELEDTLRFVSVNALELVTYARQLSLSELKRIECTY